MNHLFLALEENLYVKGPEQIIKYKISEFQRIISVDTSMS